MTDDKIVFFRDYEIKKLGFLDQLIKVKKIGRQKKQNKSIIIDEHILVCRPAE